MSSAVEPSLPQAAWRRRALIGAGIAVVVVVVWGVLLLWGLSAGFCVLVAAVLAGVTAALASEPVERRVPAAAAVVAPSGPTAAVVDEDAMRRLRHDLRGILSPALMTADRLLMTTQDPIAKRAAEAMIETVEAAGRRLSE